MFDFEKLKVYLKAREVNKEILTYLAKKQPIDLYIVDQLKRSSISIVINIAEGCGKFSSPSRRNYYKIARGSPFECVSLLGILLDIDKIEKGKYNHLYQELEEVSKMLFALSKTK